ncbi:virulence factor TspB C-terminal domain-related protein [Pseudomonas citronellolis]|uniref:virulence factor TspB C-terminal domain-related protein n=1 Tax=Pseudomonas citronellolis TaxID=53408 RepID=UPI0020A1C93A|nr:virulence factor TspB C-terminal domain-related protein [Pseudomonas citronellolis]MCP1602682.1 putative membrane protein YgcG [Pseudomonas citronellolis]MCP1653740.1 putative membrane protein YgcG [Pseudomonas citronellolis]MCP1720685.1 putative membrane protein YgcG [Pseudomonas citronellolis]
MFRLLILTICFLLSLPAWAETYYWNAVGKRFPDAMSACQAYAVEAWVFAGATVHSLALISASLAECTVRHPNGTLSQTILYRGGDSCPVGTEFDLLTGGCVKPENSCEALKGQPVSWDKKIPGYVSSGGQHGFGEFGQIDGCQFEITSLQCDAASDGSDMGYCTGEGIFTGKEGQDEPGVGGEGSNEKPDPEKPTDPETNPNPEQPETENPGESGGGAEEGDQGNGESGDGEGSGGGSGSGDGGNEGDGEGEEEGECDPATDPNQCQESGVTGEACNADLSCTGDAVQCAILEQQKALRCQLEELHDFDKYESDIAKTVEGEDFELTKDEEINVAGFLSEGTGRRFLPSACPADKTFSLRTGGGRTFAFTYAPLCQLATDLSYLIVIAATIFFAVYVGRSFGGE